MKLIVLCSFICFIDALSLNLKFNTKTSLKIYKEANETYKFYTSMVLKNETEELNGTEKTNDISCVKMSEESNNTKTNQMSLQSSCVDSYCIAYMISQYLGSLGPLKFCPLAGTLKEANLFLKKSYKILYNFNDIYIFIDGCYFINENGTKLEVLWILTDNFEVDESITSKVYENEFLFKRYRTEDIDFENINKDCSNLCKSHVCQEESVIDETEVAESVISMEDFIYVGLIICVISFVGVFIFCLKKKFK